MPPPKYWRKEKTRRPYATDISITDEVLGNEVVVLLGSEGFRPGVKNRFSGLDLSRLRERIFDMRGSKRVDSPEDICLNSINAGRDREGDSISYSAGSSPVKIVSFKELGCWWGEGGWVL